MAEVAPSAGGGGGGRNFLLIVGGLAAVLFIGLLALAAIVFLPGLLGGQQIAAVPTETPTRIVIPPTFTRTPPPTQTQVIVAQNTVPPTDTATPEPILETATPIPITATPILITATPTAQESNLPETGLGEDLLMLFGGAVLLLGVIVVARRIRSV
jgi:LPXTG-motif cell wall-anchored protein